MTDVVGLLCYVGSDGALAFKKNAGDLVFKSDGKPNVWKLEVTFSPKWWICQEYDVRHDIQIDVLGSWADGGGTIEKTVSADKTVFTLSDIEPSSVFLIAAMTESGCVTDEDPEVRLSVAGTGRARARVISNLLCPIAEPRAQIFARFNASGDLTELDG